MKVLHLSRVGWVCVWDARLGLGWSGVGGGGWIILNSTAVNYWGIDFSEYVNDYF